MFLYITNCYFEIFVKINKDNQYNDINKINGEISQENVYLPIN